MRRIAPHIAGALAVLGPVAAAVGQATPPAPAPSPAPAPGRSATYDPAVQRAAAPAPAPAQEAPAANPGPAPAAADDQGLDAILGRWEQTSGQIETLYAAFEQVDEMAIVGEKKHYKGSAYLRRPNNVVLQLEKKVVDEQGVESFAFDRRILANGAEVVEFDGPTRQITIFPMPEDAQQRTLEEGPLPFLFRMNVLEFKRRYQASLASPLQEGTHRIVIYPQHSVDRDAFMFAVLILDARTLQPRSIHTLAPNGKDKQNYYIKDLRANVEIKPELFAWDAARAQAAQKDGWRIVRNPEPQPRPAEVGLDADSQPDLSPIPR